ncbi:hypothetical protein [Priestia flexa]|uniref:hypothetical protein n=1 Tax=Priestia flexa TaxID=86664 RepID=UPI001C9882A6|nr:hypothetical protein [Priestia flexa]MBY6088222.1 hypothetical protein [Priestia flexa]
MFEWRINKFSSNIVRRGMNRYQLYYSHDNTLSDSFERVYYLLENGYPIKYFAYSFKSHNEPFKAADGLLVTANKALIDINVCPKCYHTKMLKHYNGMKICYACILSNAINNFSGGAKPMFTDKCEDILFYDKPYAAEFTIKDIALPDNFPDYENDGFSYVKGIFKIMESKRHKFYPAFFHVEWKSNDIYNIYFLKHNVHEEKQKIIWSVEMNNYLKYFAMSRLTRLLGPNDLFRNFTLDETQSSGYKIITFLSF